MIVGDYIERQRKAKSGKMVTDKIVKSTTGVEYAIGPKLGFGGAGTVYKARRVKDNMECVFKEYIPKPELCIIHNTIKKNIQMLMNNPFTDDDGNPLKEFVGPLDKDSLIELPKSKSFGYIMKFVDTKLFLSVPKIRHLNTFPDALIICKACKNIANMFRYLHFRGWCYKDVNEGNIYINNKTGEIRIIDCDNISTQKSKTILGTEGYMAPEVYVTETPDTYTDYFSMAVLFYRLLVGGYPMDGKKTFEYIEKNKLTAEKAAPIIYGSMALFAFDPKDHSNEIRGLVDPNCPKLYEFQVNVWNDLPAEIQEGFYKTFSTGLANENRAKRTTDMEWINIFQKLQDSGLIKCSCGKTNFGSIQKKVECNFCGAKLPLLKKE